MVGWVGEDGFGDLILNRLRGDGVEVSGIHRPVRPTCSTLISCLAQGIDLKRTLTLANAAGALAVTKRGPMEGNTTLSELELFIASAEIRK